MTTSFPIARADDHPFTVLEFHFLEDPVPSRVLTVAGVVFEQENRHLLLGPILL